MGEPIGKGLKQLMGVGGIEAVAESERLQSIRKLKESYWALKRCIEKQDSNLETMRRQNSLKMLLGRDDNTSDMDQLKADIYRAKNELRTINEDLEEKDVFMDRVKPPIPDVEKKDDKRNLFDMEFDTRNLFDIGDNDLPELDEIEEEIDDIPEAQEIYSIPFDEGDHQEMSRYPTPIDDDISDISSKSENEPVKPISIRKRKIKRVMMVRKRNVISSNINEMITSANDLERKGSLDKAIHLLEKQLAPYDDHEEILYQLGNLHFKNDNTDEAERYYRRAIDKNANSFRSLNNLGIILQKEGRSEEAIRSFNQAIEINNIYERAWFNLGSIFMEIDPPMYEEAAIFMRRALECDPRYEKAMGKLEICENMLG